MAVRYVAFTHQGERVSGTLPVDSERTAEEQLWQSGLIVVSLKKERPPLRFSLYEQLPTFFRPKPQELVAFTRELANLLQAGIVLLTALKVLKERIRNPLLKKAVQDIIQDVEVGTSFSQAIARHPNIFPPIYSRLVTIAEQAGRLALLLQQIATYLEKQVALSSKVRSSLRYPSMVAVVGLVAAVLLSTFALPSITNLLGEYGGKLPTSARILISFSNFLKNYGLILFAGILALASVLAFYFRTASGARRWDYLILKIPAVGNLVLYNNISRLSRTLHTLLAAGIPLAESLDLTIKTSQNAAVREALAQVKQGMLGGQRLSQAMAQHRIFPALVPQMISVGEQSGTLERNLEALANFFDEQADAMATRMTSMIEPTMIIVVGLVIGFIAITIMSSLYGVIGQIR